MLITLWPPLWCLGGRDSDSDYENPYVLGTIAPYHHRPSSTNQQFWTLLTWREWHERYTLASAESYGAQIPHVSTIHAVQCAKPTGDCFSSRFAIPVYNVLYISGMSSIIHYCTPSACWLHVSRGHVWGLLFLHFAHAACSPVAYSDFRWHLSVLVAKHDFIMPHRKKATNWANICSMRQCAKERHIFSARLKTLLFQAVVTYRIASIGYVPPDSRTKHDIL